MHIEKYGDWNIYYNESEAMFVGEFNGQRKKSQKLTSLRENIDKLDKEEKKFKRIDVFKRTPWGNNLFTEGKITSVIGKEYGSVYVWTSFDGKRSKERLSDLFIDNAENRQVWTEIDKLQAEMDILKEKKDKLYDELKNPVIEV